jgi:hypothetical protein
MIVPDRNVASPPGAVKATLPGRAGTEAARRDGKINQEMGIA